MKKFLLVLLPIVLLAVLTAYFGQTKLANRQNDTDVLHQEATKADNYAIELLIDSYQKSLVHAVNNNNFILLGNLLLPDSNFYYVQKEFVEGQYQQGITMEIKDYDILDIVEGESEGVYRVYVVETISKKSIGSAPVEEELRCIFTVVNNDEVLVISAKEEWF